MKLLALTKYGSLAASTRQRFMQYEPALGQAGISIDYAPLLDNDYLQLLAEGRAPSKLGIMKGYARRFAQLIAARSYDALWVYCELFPYFPSFMERLVEVAGLPVVYDYDDAIFHNYDSSARPLVRQFLGGKLEPLLRRASVCVCGNEYLRAYAAQFNDVSVIIPTVVDTDRYRPVENKRSRPLTIGWIGSPSTWENVQPLLPVIAELCSRHDVRFRVVGAGPAARSERFDGMELAEWSEAREISEVQSFDIGVMPLLDRPFQRGKSGYKLVQYMACGLPVVASPIGVNSELVTEGQNGFLAGKPDRWREVLEQLILDPALRASMGAAGRYRAEQDYSLKAQAPRLVEIVREAVGTAASA